jgi:sugar lactone lactonase YvrE
MSKTKGFAIDNVLSARARLGECPVWDPQRRLLLWVDVYNHRVHRFDPATGQDRFVETDDVVSAIAPTEDGRWLVALRDRLALLSPDGETKTLCELPLSHPDSRLNDGKCDTRGRFWVGSISKQPGEAELYRYDPDGSLHVMERGLTLSNGLGWSPDDTAFYLTDSPTRNIYVYRFDAETGEIHDRRGFCRLEEGVEPDGMAIDRAGNLWTALWNGWCVACFDPTGRELARTPLPVQRPTSLAFGGPSLADLYVTTASVGLSQEDIQRGFFAGDLFRIAAALPGMPTHRFSSLA